MARKRLTTKQRDKIADKLMMLGNIVFSGMVIAPLISSQFSGANIVISFIGGGVFTTIYLVAVQVMKGGASN